MVWRKNRDKHASLLLRYQLYPERCLWSAYPGNHKTWPCCRVNRPPLLLVTQPRRIAPGDSSGSRHWKFNYLPLAYVCVVRTPLQGKFVNTLRTYSVCQPQSCYFIYPYILQTQNLQQYSQSFSSLFLFARVHIITHFVCFRRLGYL